MGQDELKNNTDTHHTEAIQANTLKVPWIVVPPEQGLENQ